MTHGAPDYSNVQKLGGVYRLDDMAELAARLGSLMSYDRRGDIFWSYGFNDGIGDFTELALGANAAVSLNNTYFHNPPYSLELKSGDAIGNLARISRLFPVPYNLTMGFAVAVRPTATTDTCVIDVMHYTGSVLHYTNLIIDFANGQITISNQEDDPYTITTSVGYLSSSFVFNHFKLVVDLNDHTLVRFGLNDNNYSLAGYTMKNEASATAERIYFDVLNKNTAALSTEMYVDSIIITTNEV
jgi:hypothetical protein